MSVSSARASRVGGLPITRASLAVISDPDRQLYVGMVRPRGGLITCRMRPAMPAGVVFSIAFGPKLPKGTKLLVKFRTAAGDRSYAVVTTR